VKSDLKEEKSDFKKSLELLPKKPGIYIFRDKNGRVIYVGKAKNLSSRVRSYFQSRSRANNLNHPISFFTGKITSYDYIVTDNEVEALILENSLIKKNRPKYNVFLKDDKSYPFVAITESENFPRVFITRNKNIRKAKYYGPYTNVKNLRDFLEELRKIFKIRDCKKTNPGKVKNSVCLNYHIGLCAAPCIGKIAQQDYRQNIEYIKLFLRGRDKKIREILKRRMEDYSEKQEYEMAGTVKEQMDLLEKLSVSQNIFFSGENDWDVVSCFYDAKSKNAAISVFTYKSGELAAISNFMVSSLVFDDDKIIIGSFIKGYYPEIDNLSPIIYTPVKIEDSHLIEQWLSGIKTRKIRLMVSDRGEKRDISDMVSRNARLYLEKKMFEKSSGYSKVFNELVSLKKYLSLENIPRRIECYDISNIGPDFAVGSMAVFADGSPLLSNYRHFRIRNAARQDDFAMISEIITRRVKYFEKLNLNIEDSFYIKPDLIVIDGGKAQLSAAKKVLQDSNLSSIDLISIAKKQEIVFSGKFPDGFPLDRRLSFAKIILKIRDEAHRFALDYHKKLRSKYMTNSVLDGIRGIGPKKKSFILEKYGTPEEIKSCTLQDLINIKGLAYSDAVNIYNSLNRY